jgi:hypothetical protein
MASVGIEDWTGGSTCGRLQDEDEALVDLWSGKEVKRGTGAQEHEVRR